MEEAINLEALEELRSLMGDSLHDVLRTFIEFVPNQINELDKAINNVDADHRFGAECFTELGHIAAHTATGTDDDA